MTLLPPSCSRRVAGHFGSPRGWREAPASARCRLGSPRRAFSVPFFTGRLCCSAIRVGFTLASRHLLASPHPRPVTNPATHPPPGPRDHSHPPAGTTLASPSPSSALHPASLLCWTAGLTLSGCGPRPKAAVPFNLPVGPSSDRERVGVTHIRHECEGKMGHRTAQEQARGLWSDVASITSQVPGCHWDVSLAQKGLRGRPVSGGPSPGHYLLPGVSPSLSLSPDSPRLPPPLAPSSRQGTYLLYSLMSTGRPLPHLALGRDAGVRTPAPRCC